MALKASESTLDDCRVCLEKLNGGPGLLEEGGSKGSFLDILNLGNLENISVFHLVYSINTSDSSINVVFI